MLVPLARPAKQVYFSKYMIAHLDAVARLLKDGDPETVRLVKEQLLAGGDENLRDLEALASSGDEDVCRHARELVGELAHREAEDDFDIWSSAKTYAWVIFQI